ncbi:MAG TPA: hypothetical protein VGM19_05260 [Armatimonadota bacterium]|jgi:hypothetical protein
MDEEQTTTKKRFSWWKLLLVGLGLVGLGVGIYGAARPESMVGQGMRNLTGPVRRRWRLFAGRRGPEE